MHALTSQQPERRSNHILNRMLEAMAGRLGEQHGGVTVTVHEGVPPTRLTRQQVLRLANCCEVFAWRS